MQNPNFTVNDVPNAMSVSDAETLAQSLQQSGIESLGSIRAKEGEQKLKSILREGRDLVLTQLQAHAELNVLGTTTQENQSLISKGLNSLDAIASALEVSAEVAGTMDQPRASKIRQTARAQAAYLSSLGPVYHNPLSKAAAHHGSIPTLHGLEAFNDIRRTLLP